MLAVYLELLYNGELRLLWWGCFYREGKEAEAFT